MLIVREEICGLGTYPVLRDLSRVEGEENLVPHLVAFLVPEKIKISQEVAYI